jgi:hypothetical protein
MLVFAPLSLRSACRHCDPAGRIPIAVKSGKDKTGYMLFGTRWKEGRDGFPADDNTQVFVRVFPTRQAAADGLCSISSRQTNQALAAHFTGKKR